MAESSQPQSTNAPPAKTRSPVERLLVWGLIGVLAVAAGFEYLSKMGHEKALNKLHDALALVDKDSTHPEVTEADVKAAVGDKKPSKREDYGPGKVAPNGGKRLDVYSWFTLNPTNKREIYVWYGAKGKDPNELATVIEVQASEITSPIPHLAGSSEPNADAGLPSAAGGGGAGMSGPPGGGMGGPGGMMRGGPGGRSGRPGADKAADADKADADKADAQTTDDDKTSTDKDSEEKPGEDKTGKADTDKE